MDLEPTHKSTHEARRKIEARVVTTPAWRPPDEQAVAQANRKAMPLVTAFVDELRRHFPGARVTYARENGWEKGKQGAL